MNKNAMAFLKMYRDLSDAPHVVPRGETVKERQNYVLELDMVDSPCTSFEDRKFNLNYAKAEMRWYLRGDKFDRSIEEYASMWPKLVQPDGSYYSNYGQYIFKGGQFDWVVEELRRDKDSRRASMVLLKREHFFKDNRDVVCTYGLGFRIRQDRLNMTVHMRSNDAVFGTSNDVFCFACVYRMVFAAMRFSSYPNLVPGNYVHIVDSLHVYEKHWQMVDRIVERGLKGYTEIDVPYPSSLADLAFLLSVQVLGGKTPPPSGFALSNFLWKNDGRP